MKKDRLFYLDFVKAIAIIMVVFCHYTVLPNDTVAGNILMTMTWMAVPYFLFVSGGLAHASGNWEWKKYLKNLLHIYLTIVVWRAIYFFYFNQELELGLDGFQAFNFIALCQKSREIPSGFFWYMTAFLILQFLLPITKTLFSLEKKGESILFFIMVICFLGGNVPHSISFIWSTLGGLEEPPVALEQISSLTPFTNYSYVIVYYLMGAFLFRYREKLMHFLSTRKHRFLLLLLWVGSTGMLLIIKFALTETFYWERIYLQNGYLWISNYLASTSTYLLLMYASETYIKKLHIGRFLARFVGENTLGIYYMHLLSLYFIVDWMRAEYLDSFSVGLNFAKTFLSVAICALITEIVKRIPLLKELTN